MDHDEEPPPTKQQALHRPAGFYKADGELYRLKEANGVPEFYHKGEWTPLRKHSEAHSYFLFHAGHITDKEAKRLMD